MKIFNTTGLLLSALLIAAPMLANAQVIYPALDIQKRDGDTGADYIIDDYVDADATAFRIVFDNSPTQAVPETEFTFTSSYNTGTGLYEGSFSAGSLLSGTFSDMNVTFNSTMFGTDFFVFDGTVSYTGGSLATGFSGGTMDGGFDSNGTFTVKIGEVAVIPVPAAIWLFGSGLLGLVAVSRRRA